MLVSTPKPRGPWNFPVVGHLPAFRAKPIQFLMGIAREYGDLPYFRLGGFHVYLINHPDLVREVLVTQQSNFIKSRIISVDMSRVSPAVQRWRQRTAYSDITAAYAASRSR